MFEKLSDLMPTFERSKISAADIKVAPWMEEFMKERHSQAEWNWFFWYLEATPFQRFMSEFGSLFVSFFGRRYE
jgi:hypothetical protein